jgi:PTH1 family peptidyl-tRNA hydrolase
MFVDRLADKYKIHKTCSLAYEEKEKFIVVKPLTYMNRSGAAVRYVLDRFNSSEKDLFVVCDDFNLDLGKFRLRGGGSSGGHNGLQSIIDSIGTSEFTRLRIGIGGNNVPDKVEYVLENFTRKELKIIDDVLFDAPAIVNFYIENGLEKTMNKIIKGVYG